MPTPEKATGESPIALLTRRTEYTTGLPVDEWLGGDTLQCIYDYKFCCIWLS